MRTSLILAAFLAPGSLIAGAQAQETRPGLSVSIYDIGHDMRLLPTIAAGELPNDIHSVDKLDLNSQRGDFGKFQNHYMTVATGLLVIEEPGVYTLRLISDDGSRLWVDGRVIINHDGWHGPVPKDARLHLDKGQHPICVEHFNNWGDAQLTLQWQTPDVVEPDQFEVIPAEALAHAARKTPLKTAPGQKRVIPALRRGLPGDGAPVAGIHPSLTTRKARPASTDQYTELADKRIAVLGEAPAQRPDKPFVWCPPAITGYELTKPITCKDDILVGNGTTGEIYRIALDECDGHVQGCAFRFSGGHPQDFNTLRREPQGGLMIARLPEKAEVPEQTKTPRAEQFFEPTMAVPFEMKNVKVANNGLIIELVSPLDARCGWDPESYYVEQWPFEFTASGQAEESSRPQRTGEPLTVKSASVTPDFMEILLEIDGLLPNQMIYLRALPPFYSAMLERPWTTEAWLTVTDVPESRSISPITRIDDTEYNTLTPAEEAEGWELLFDGKTTKGWRGYRQQEFPDGWKVQNNCLVLTGPAGDIITERQFENFELCVEWRICAAGNSGIFYRVDESVGAPYETGPEMQVLDNAEHPDGKNPTTSAGSNYALYAPIREIAAPVGFFNKARVVVKGNHVEHWLNNFQVVEYELGSADWKERVANSKFKAWPKYGTIKKGNIVLQDHGDKVWYRNIKIRELPDTE